MTLKRPQRLSPTTLMAHIRSTTSACTITWRTTTKPTMSRTSPRLGTEDKMTDIPSFEELISKDWFVKCLENGSFDPEHGSYIDDLVMDIQHGVSWLPQCP